MSGPAYKQPQVVPPDLVPSSESLPLATESRVDPGAFAVCPSGPGVSCQAYDKPHVVLTGSVFAKPSPLEHLDFSSAQVVGVRKQVEPSPAFVVTINGRTVILRRGQKESPDPEKPSLASGVLLAQEVRLTEGNVNQALADTDIVSDVTELTYDQMKALIPAIKSSNDPCKDWFLRTIESAREVKVRSTPLDPIDFTQGIRVIGIECRLGNESVLVHVGQDYYAFEKIGTRIYGEKFQVVVGAGGKAINEPVSRSRPLEPEEVGALQKELETSLEAAKSLFPQAYEEVEPVK